MSVFQIGGSVVENRKRTFLIAEVGQAHEGSLGAAHAYIDLAANVGFDAVKFQLHHADSESTLDEMFRVTLSSQDSTRYDYWKRMEFSFEGWLELKTHADELGLEFLCTPFSVLAAEWLERLEVKCWKIGSGDIENDDLIDFIIQTKKPIIVSTGMASWSQIDDVYNKLSRAGCTFGFLQCTSKYPTGLAETGLNVMRQLEERYGLVAGMSIHSCSVTPALAAIAHGAGIVELHCCFSRGQFGPDIRSSLEPNELELVARFRNEYSEMIDNPVDKDSVARELSGLSKLFGRSLGISRAMRAGDVVSRSDLVSKKPGGGIDPRRRSEFVGAKLIRDVDPKRLLRFEDFYDD